MEINSTFNIRPAAVAAKPVAGNEEAQGPSARVSGQTTEKIQELQQQSIEEGRELEAEEVDTVVENLNKFAQSIRRDLSFSLQNETGRIVVEVTDSNTGELIRKIPSEEALKISERIAEVRSLLTSVKA